MPTEGEIQAQILVIRARIAEYQRFSPSLALNSISDSDLRAEAWRELTGGSDPPPVPDPVVPDTHLDDRYVQIG